MLIISLSTFTKLLSNDFSAEVFFEIAALNLKWAPPNKGGGVDPCFPGIGGFKVLSPSFNTTTNSSSNYL